jgi:hypothetical protein
MKKSLLTALGFLLFFLGVLSLVLSLVGLKFSFLAFMDMFGALPSFIIKLSMIFGGIILIVLSKANPEQEI